MICESKSVHNEIFIFDLSKMLKIMNIHYNFRYLRHKQWEKSHDHRLTNQEVSSLEEDKEYDSDEEYILGNSMGIIRIYHECEDGIEKSVPRITDWHHESCRVMTIGDHEGQIFLSYPHTYNTLNQNENFTLYFFE